MTPQIIVRGLVISILGIILIAGEAVRAEQKQVQNWRSSQNPIVAAGDHPWSAVGKLNNGVFGSCTAVLVSRQYALTAAHCLFFKKTGKFLPAQSLHLVFGFENGIFKEHLRVSAYHVSSTYDPLRPYETLTSDWALLSIAGEVSAAIQPIDILPKVNISSSLKLTAAGYSRLTPYRMTADIGCHFVGRTEDSGLFFDSCHVPEGYSGGPVLSQISDKHSFSVVGIHIGNQVWRGKPIAVAVPSETIWREIKPCIENQKCHFEFEHVATGRDPTAAEVLAGLHNQNNRNRFELTSNVRCATKAANATNDKKC